MQTECNKGIAGVPTAHFSVVETQGRGSLHMHSLWWAGVPAAITQLLAGRSEFDTALTTAIDSRVQAALAGETHLAVMAARREHVLLPASAVLQVSNTIAEFNDHVDISAAGSNRHMHSDTCWTRGPGSHCRMGLPAMTAPETSLIELVLAPAGSQPVHRVRPHVTPASLHRTGDVMDRLVQQHDRLVIPQLARPSVSLDLPTIAADVPQRCQANIGKRTWEAALPAVCKLLQRRRNNTITPADDELFDKLPLQNAMVAAFSPAVTAVLGCNNAFSYIGAIVAGMIVLMYLVKYMTKDPVPIASASVLLHQVLQKYPSKASDAGTPSRTAQYVAQRFLNSQGGSVEVLAQIAAHTCTGGQATYTSEQFGWTNIATAVADVKSMTAAVESDADNTDADAPAASGANDADADSDDEDDDDDLRRNLIEPLQEGREQYAVLLPSIHDGDDATTAAAAGAATPHAADDNAHAAGATGTTTATSTANPDHSKVGYGTVFHVDGNKYLSSCSTSKRTSTGQWSCTT